MYKDEIFDNNNMKGRGIELYGAKILYNIEILSINLI